MAPDQIHRPERASRRETARHTARRVRNSAAKSPRCASPHSKPRAVAPRDLRGVGVTEKPIASTRRVRRHIDTATSMPSSDVPLMIPATRDHLHLPLQFLLQLREQLQRLDGPQLVQIECRGSARRSRTPPARRAESAPDPTSSACASSSVTTCSVRSCSFSTSRARSITLSGSPASRATSIP